MATDRSNVFLIADSPWVTSTPKKARTQPRKASAFRLHQSSSGFQRASNESLAALETATPRGLIASTPFAFHAVTSTANDDHVIGGSTQVTSVDRGVLSTPDKNKLESPSSKAQKEEVGDAQPKEIFICNNCGKGLNTATSLESHRESFHSLVKCRFCDESVIKLTLHRHLISKHEELLSKELSLTYCPEEGCGKRMKDTYLEKHMVNFHQAYTCTTCNTTLTGQRAFWKHRRTFRQQCGSARAMVDNARLTRPGRSKASSAARFHCTLCEFITRTKKGLRSHTESCHVQAEAQAEAESRPASADNQDPQADRDFEPTLSESLDAPMSPISNFDTSTPELLFDAGLGSVADINISLQSDEDRLCDVASTMDLSSDYPFGDLDIYPDHSFTKLQ